MGASPTVSLLKINNWCFHKFCPVPFCSVQLSLFTDGNCILWMYLFYFISALLLFVHILSVERPGPFSYTVNNTHAHTLTFFKYSGEILK